MLRFSISRLDERLQGDGKNAPIHQLIAHTEMNAHVVVDCATISADVSTSCARELAARQFNHFGRLLRFFISTKMTEALKQLPLTNRIGEDATAEEVGQAFELFLAFITKDAPSSAHILPAGERELLIRYPVPDKWAVSGEEAHIQRLDKLAPPHVSVTAREDNQIVIATRWEKGHQASATRELLLFMRYSFLPTLFSDAVTN